MSWFERVLPGVAARHARARYRALAWRRAADVLEGQGPRRRRYEAATRGRRTEGWRTSSTSAISEVGPALALLRDRSRDLVRNNQWAKKAVGVLQARTVGTGIVPRPVAAAEAPARVRDAAAALRELWREWAETTECDADGRTNLYGLQSQSQRSIVEAGEVLARRRWRRTSDGLSVPFQIQLLEPDHLDPTKTGQLSNGNRVIQGVEFDKLGRRVAYWLFREHPGNSLHGFYSRATTPSVRVPASDVIHAFRPDRIGQVRGVPWGASCLLKLRDYDDWDDATLVRQKVAACFAGFIHDIDAAVSEGTGPGALEKDSAGRLIDEIEPGMLQELAHGQDITFASPPPAMGFEEYANLTLRAVAAGFGVTYEALTGDLSSVNFSSGRMGWLEMESEIQSWRRTGFIPQLCQGIWRWFLDGAELAGGVNERLPASWTPPRREMLDPLKEVKAMRESVRSGFSSLSEALRSLGHDPRELLDELKDDLGLVDELGLALDSDPRGGQASTAGGQGERAALAGVIREALAEALLDVEMLGDGPGRNGSAG